MVVKLHSKVLERCFPEHVVFDSKTELRKGKELPCQIEHYNEDFRALYPVDGKNRLRVKDEDTVELLSDSKVIKTLSGDIINEAQKLGSNYEWIWFRVSHGEVPISQRLKIAVQEVRHIASLGFIQKYYTEGELIWEPSKERK